MKKLIASLLEKVAENTASSATWIISYQPEEPEALKKDK